MRLHPPPNPPTTDPKVWGRDKNVLRLPDSNPGPTCPSPNRYINSAIPVLNLRNATINTLFILKLSPVVLQLRHYITQHTRARGLIFGPPAFWDATMRRSVSATAQRRESSIASL